MIKKILKKIGYVLFTNFSFVVAFLVLFLIFTFKFPYIIESPGGLINLNDRIKVENTYEINGSYNMTYVTTRNATIPGLILSYFNKDWDVYSTKEYIESGTTLEEDDLRGKIYLKESNNNAVMNAFNMAGYSVTITDESVFVVYVDEKANTDLKVGDEIISIDGVTVTSSEQLSLLSNIYNVGDKVNILVNSNNKEYNRYAYVYNMNDKKVFGIYVSLNRELKHNPSVEFNFSKSEYGSSAGLMQALYIYDSITQKDISNGLKIAGTGALNAKGEVLTISGIKYKLKGAVKEKTDIFFVPNGENYEEAIKLVNENKYKLNVVGVSTFDDALLYLYNYKKSWFQFDT